MPTARQAAAAAVVDGILYVIGGSPSHLIQDSGRVVEAYNPKTDMWSTKAPMPTPRCCMAIGVIDGLIHVVGGSGYVGALSTHEVYDPKTDTWTTRAPMPTPRYALTGSVVNGILYAIGGFYPGYHNVNYDIVEVYDPKSDAWITKAPMPTPRGYMASGVVDGLIYVAGGLRTFGSEGSELLARLEAYDPETDTWTARAPLPTAGTSGVSGVAAGRLYVVGLFPNFPAYAYNPASNTWETVPPVPTERTGAAGGCVDETLYVVGGRSTSSLDVLAVNEAFSPFLAVGIDIKPGDPRNTINLKSAGTVPVAILGSATFDPLTVDPATVTLAGAPVATRARGVPMIPHGGTDFDGDGYLDLLLHFRTQDLQLTSTSTEAVLYGETFSGQRLRGSDSVRIVGLVGLRSPAMSVREPRGRAALQAH